MILRFTMFWVGSSVICFLYLWSITGYQLIELACLIGILLALVMGIEDNGNKRSS